MAHVHAGNRSSFYLEQLWTIATCGALGVVMILLWWYKVLAIFLDPKFHDPVLWGGIALLVLVAVRIVSLWSMVGQTVVNHEHVHGDAAEHGHEHGPDCDHHHHGHEHHHHHDHAQPQAAGDVSGTKEGQNHAHTHDHDHDHDHGFAPWRYAVLLVPIVLFFMRIPWPQPDEPVEENVIAMKLSEAEQSAESADFREHWKKEMETKSVRLKAKFGSPYRGDRMFNIVRLKMTCCAADAYGEPARIIVESPRPLDMEKFKDHWLKITGKLDYRQLGGSDRYVTVVKAESVKPIPTPANQFNN